MRASSPHPLAPAPATPQSLSSLSTGFASTTAAPASSSQPSNLGPFEDVFVSGRSSPATSLHNAPQGTPIECSVDSRSALHPFQTELTIDVPDSPSKSRADRWTQRWRNNCTTQNVLRIAPILALIVTSTGLYFGVKNFLTLEASRATSILRTLGPALRAAHVDIQAAIATIQRHLGIPTMPPNGTSSGLPPLQPPGR